MPIYLQKDIPPAGEVGLWDITETETFFRKELSLDAAEEQRLAQIHSRRRKEWMAGRLLLHQMSGRPQRMPAPPDEQGKPQLPDSEYDISLSHSGRFAAVIAAPMLVGIDIQEIVPKMERIQHKFMTPADLAGLSQTHYLAHLHVHWGAKEALYKAYGKRKLEFRKHIVIHPFNFDVTFGHCSGYVEKDNIYLPFNIHYQTIENYMLVYAIQT